MLADDMGMGKSLSTLALIMKTLEAAHTWANEKRSEEHISGKVRRHSHSTLIIVPSALLINHWLREITTHTGDALKTIKYHGQGRERDLTALEESDVVITTYNTLAAEAAAKKSQLHKINWYRVVLDEGKLVSPAVFIKTGLTSHSAHHPPTSNHFLPTLRGPRGSISLVSDWNSYPKPARGYWRVVCLPSDRAVP